MAVALFILIRHAESLWQLDEARPLSPAGQTAARQLAQRLASIDFGAIYSSPYARAYQTVEPLATRNCLPISVVDDLRERAIGNTGAVPFADAVCRSWKEPATSWPGGESLLAAQDRIVRCVSELIASAPQKPIALSTHGSILAALLHTIDPTVGFEFWLSLRFPDAIQLNMLDPARGTFTRL